MRGEAMPILLFKAQFYEGLFLGCHPLFFVYPSYYHAAGLNSNCFRYSTVESTTRVARDSPEDQDQSK